MVSVLRKRQPDLTVVLENVHDPHNIGAVLRSCDAVGTLTVHTVYTIEERPTRAYARSTSGSASKWIDVVHHNSIAECYAALRAAGLTVLVAALTESAQDLYESDLTGPVAVVFGNEQRGASEEAIAQADGALYIPMMGMVESLNISVACAVTLFEALRQRLAQGRYDSPALPDGELARLAEEWIRR
ncbi:MAG: RNA methyltransferase [Chloroflexota bacterium]|nr:RNA methyltransferase [Chloroflexota bacterium]